MVQNTLFVLGPKKVILQFFDFWPPDPTQSTQNTKNTQNTKISPQIVIRQEYARILNKITLTPCPRAGAPRAPVFSRANFPTGRARTSVLAKNDKKSRKSPKIDPARAKRPPIFPGITLARGLFATFAPDSGRRTRRAPTFSREMPAAARSRFRPPWSGNFPKTGFSGLKGGSREACSVGWRFPARDPAAAAAQPIQLGPTREFFWPPFTRFSRCGTPGRASTGGISARTGLNFGVFGHFCAINCAASCPRAGHLVFSRGVAVSSRVICYIWLARTHIGPN